MTSPSSQQACPALNRSHSWSQRMPVPSRTMSSPWLLLPPSGKSPAQHVSLLFWRSVWELGRGSPSGYSAWDYGWGGRGRCWLWHSAQILGDLVIIHKRHNTDYVVEGQAVKQETSRDMFLCLLSFQTQKEQEKEQGRKRQRR